MPTDPPLDPDKATGLVAIGEPADQSGALLDHHLEKPACLKRLGSRRNLIRSIIAQEAEELDDRARKYTEVIIKPEERWAPELRTRT